MLAELPTLTLLLWALVTLFTVVLLGWLFVSGRFRTYTYFTIYLGVNLLQTAVGLYLYQSYGFQSLRSYYLAWTTQGFVVIARAFAAAEVCYLILGPYRGIWALAIRILLCCSAIALGIGLYFGKYGYQDLVITLEIGLETFIATWVVGLFVFARYYEVRIPRALRLIGLGLALYSCMKIVNDAFLEKFLTKYVTVWNYGTSGTFAGILLIWIWAMRKPVFLKTTAPALHSADEYQVLIPHVNRRLLELNERLSQLWHLDSTKR